MPNRDRRSSPAMQAVVLLASSATLMVPFASAGGKNSPAPIVYAGTKPNPTAASTPPAARPSAVQPQARPTTTAATGYSTPSRAGERIVTSPSRRIEFRYPDDPTPSYSASVPRELSTPAPGPAHPGFTPPVLDPGLAVREVPPATVEMAALGPVDTRPTRPAVEYSKPTTVTPRFEPAAAANFKEVGMASWYGPNFDGKPTASGEIFDQDALTGAHPTLPLPSLVEVTNLETGKALVIRINDRGPFVDGRILDVSRAAARELGFEHPGMARVQVRYLGPAEDEVQTAQLDGGASPSSPPPVQTAYTVPPASGPAASRPPVTSVPVTSGPVASTPVSTGYGNSETYLVQIGSFTDVGNAQLYAERARSIGPVSIRQARINGADYFRVMIGPVSGRSEAERLQGRLGAAGFGDSMIKRAD